MEIFVYEVITPALAASVVQELSKSASKSVTVRVNSPGGDVMAGISIANAIKSFTGKIVVQIEGMCASAATLFCCVAKTNCAENAMLMIHNPLFASSWSTSDTLRKSADVLDKISVVMIDMYCAKTRQPAEFIKKMLAEGETWFSAMEAKTFGLVDTIVPKINVATNYGALKIPQRFLPRNEILLRSFVNEHEILKSLDELISIKNRALELWVLIPEIHKTYPTAKAFADFCLKTAPSFDSHPAAKSDFDSVKNRALALWARSPDLHKTYPTAKAFAKRCQVTAQMF
ncbi:MAG: Clp protease ClpP [Candidatus Contendobacter sp.]|nr:Clp protease ClpP [Candidatus Contendobacter sp.]